MTNEQAKSELMQIYMSLSEEKKQAFDVLMDALEQQSIPTMVYPQVDGITPTVVAQADGEKTCGTCRNEDTYHCAECENKSDYEQAQADREYILKKDVMGCIGQTSLHWELARKLRKLPSVAIPPDHDGCKDCRWQSRSETEMPCKQCKHNYTDEWQKKPHWIEHEHEAGENWEYSRYECSECHEWSDDDSNFCPNCGAKMD
jgi:RNA polymerase subunit RPABC4/transcription elongation factor Spt4